MAWLHLNFSEETLIGAELTDDDGEVVAYASGMNFDRDLHTTSDYAMGIMQHKALPSGSLEIQFNVPDMEALQRAIRPGA